jgi:hypothetical protein
MNMPGRFNKAASVLTSASSQPLVFKLEGNVIPRKKSVHEEYPFDLGDGVRLAVNYHDFAYVGRGEERVERIGIINTSSRSATLKLLPKQTSGLLDVSCPVTIRAQEQTEIMVRYTVDKGSGRYGTLSDVYGFSVNGREARTILSTTAIAVDRYDRNIDDISLPRGELSKKIVKFGEILCDNSTLVESIELSNSGESALIIRAIESDSEAVTVEVDGGHAIEKGEVVGLTIRLNTALIEDRDNPFVTRIRIITNDPMMPMQVIKVNAIPL